MWCLEYLANNNYYSETLATQTALWLRQALEFTAFQSEAHWTAAAAEAQQATTACMYVLMYVWLPSIYYLESKAQYTKMSAARKMNPFW